VGAGTDVGNIGFTSRLPSAGGGRLAEEVVVVVFSVFVFVLLAANIAFLLIVVVNFPAITILDFTPREFTRDLMTHALDQLLGSRVVFIEIGAVAAAEHGPGGVKFGVHLRKTGGSGIAFFVEAGVDVGGPGDDVVVDVGDYLGG